MKQTIHTAKFPITYLMSSRFDLKRPLRQKESPNTRTHLSPSAASTCGNSTNRARVGSHLPGQSYAPPKPCQGRFSTFFTRPGSFVTCQYGTYKPFGIAVTLYPPDRQSPISRLSGQAIPFRYRLWLVNTGEYSPIPCVRLTTPSNSYHPSFIARNPILQQRFRDFSRIGAPQ